MNETKKESSKGVKITSIKQGGWYNANNPLTIKNGSHVETGASACKIAAEDGQTTGTFLNKINNGFSAGENITNNQRVGGVGLGGF